MITVLSLLAGLRRDLFFWRIIACSQIIFVTHAYLLFCTQRLIITVLKGLVGFLTLFFCFASHNRHIMHSKAWADTQRLFPPLTLSWKPALYHLSQAVYFSATPHPARTTPYPTGLSRTLRCAAPYLNTAYPSQPQRTLSENTATYLSHAALCLGHAAT